VRNQSAGSDVVVIGAGLVGTAVAYRVAQAGVRVTLVEAKHVGSGASGNTFAWLNTYETHSREYRALRVRSLTEYDVLTEEVAARDCVHRDGGLVWDTYTESPFGDRLSPFGDLDQAVRMMRSMGDRVDEISAAEALTLEPDLALPINSLKRIYRMPSDGWVEAVGLSHLLARRAVQEYGARLELGHAVIGFSFHGESIKAAELDDGRRIEADLIINTSGPSAAVTAALAGASLPVERSPGVLFVTSSAPVHIKHVIHAPGVALRPDSATRVMIHRSHHDSTITEGDQLTSEDARSQDALKAAGELLPGLASAKIESVRIGVRAVPTDGVSIVGHDPRVAGLYHVCTHSGITLAPVLGRLVADELAGAVVRELEPFRPDRFAQAGPAPV
jgi:glycine/D-amino acid oxidase-like deaminating enzyme